MRHPRKSGRDYLGMGADAPGTPYLDDLPIDLRAILHILRRRLLLIQISVVASSLITLFVFFQLTPLYTAVTTVMIGGRDGKVVDIEAVMAGLSPDAATIESELEVIRSRRLISRVVDKLELEQLREYNPTLKVGIGEIAATFLLQTLPRAWAAPYFPRSSDHIKIDSDESPNTLHERVVDAVLSRLSVEEIGHSHVIRILFTSESPDIAAAVANSIADLYIIAQLEAKFDATARGNAWLSDRLKTLRNRAETSEQAVELYRRQNGVVQGRGVPLESENISYVTAQLAIESTKRADAEARLQEVEKLLGTGSAVDTFSGVLASDLIIKLREQEAEVQRKISELRGEYGQKHPRMVAARAELVGLEERIQSEVNRIVEGLRGEVSVARAREISLQKNLNDLKTKIGEMDQAQVQLRALEREANANRQVLETFLTRSKETENQESFLEADASVLSRANVPIDPSSPNSKVFLAISFVVGLALGIALAILLELWDQSYRSLEQLESDLRVPALGLVPQIVRFAAFGKRPEHYLLQRPRSTFAESIRNLRASLVLSDVDHPPRVILVTSSLPEEGKTVIARSLAYQAASMGKKTILLDSDLRRPSLHKSNRSPLTPGLTDFLTGEVGLSAVVRDDGRSGCHYITAGSPDSDPASLLASPRMRQLFEHLSDSYDLVVVDSSPTLAGADTRFLSQQADTTLFLVRWGKCPRDVANSGLRILVEFGADIAGVVLTTVDTRRHAFYSYSDSRYYRKLKKYYAREMQ